MADCKRLPEVNLINFKNIFFKCINIFGDKIILSHLYVSLSHFSFCTHTQKTFQLNLFGSLFVTTWLFFLNWVYCNNKKKVFLNLVFIKLPNKMYFQFPSLHFLVKVFFFFNILLLNNGCKFFVKRFFLTQLFKIKRCFFFSQNLVCIKKFEHVFLI